MAGAIVKLIDDIIAKHTIAIFSKTTCPFCKKVKDLFDSINQTYYALELNTEENGSEVQNILYEKTKQKTVPNVFIRGQHVGGCDSVLKAHADYSLHEMLEGKYKKSDYDLIVIGGGSGGIAAAKEASSNGKKVAVCDFVTASPYGTTWGLGGTCVNVGCIPKKLMHKAAIIGHDIQDAPSYGWSISEKVNHDWRKMVENIQSYIKSLNFGYRKLLRENNVTYINALAQFVGPHEIKVTDKKGKVSNHTAQNFIIAVGGRPNYPDIPGAREYGITSDDLFSLEQHPGKTLVIGASYIALECAGFLSSLGIDTTVMVRSILLRGFDQQIAEMIGEHMSKHGVKFIRPAVPLSVEKLEDGQPNVLKVTAENLETNKVFAETYNTVIFAVGRQACTENLGLDIVGVKTNPKNQKIIVDKQERTNVPYIFAVGDVLDGKPELTPVAIQAGKCLAGRLAGKHNIITNYRNVPTTVFTPLEYGCVGLSEEEAIEIFSEENVEVYHSHFQPLEYALPERDDGVSYAKLVCVKSMEELVVGVHYLGPNAGEVLQGFAIALKFQAKKSDFADLIGIHPTCAEIFTTMSITKSSGLSVAKTSC